MIIDLNKIYLDNEFDLQFQNCGICGKQYSKHYQNNQRRCFGCKIIVEVNITQSKITNIWFGWDCSLNGNDSQPFWAYIPNNSIKKMSIRIGEETIKYIPVNNPLNIKKLLGTFETCRLLI